MKKFMTVRVAPAATHENSFDEAIEILINDGWEIISLHCVSGSGYGFDSGLIYDTAYLTKEVNEE